MRQLLKQLLATDVSREKIGRFLEAEPRRGAGTVRDQVAAEMANQLLAALGQPTNQSGQGARRLRERGLWRVYDKRPSE